MAWGMRRALTIFALSALAAPGVAHAQSGGSAPASQPPAPVAVPTVPAPSTGSLANVGGTAPDTSPAGRGATGGNTASRPFRIPPVIRSFSASPRSLVWGSGPTRLRFRVDATNLRSVRVVLGVRRRGARRERAVSLGRVRTGRTVARRWARAGLAPGTYRLSFDLVEEFRFWFAELGSQPLDLPVEVKPRIGTRRLTVNVHGPVDAELEAALAAQDEPLVGHDAVAVAHLVAGAVPAPDWSRLLLDAHAEGYAAVGPAILPESRGDRRLLAAWAAGGGRNPRFGEPLLMPSLLTGLEPLEHEGLPAYAGPDRLFEGRAVVRLRSRSGRPSG